jgi:transcriptional regulator with XRE-family HTH domain
MTICDVLGFVLREERFRRDLSQGDIEARTGLLRAYISRIENGHTIPGLDTLSRIAEAMGVPVSDLISKAEASLHKQHLEGTQ